MFLHLLHSDIQWRTKEGSQFLKSHCFFRVGPKDLSFFCEAGRISLLCDVFRRFEKKMQLVGMARKLVGVVF